MQIPNFPECDRNLVKSLIHLSDYDLIDSMQKSPMDGKYFTALFCRYSPVVYSLIRHSARSPVQADYLFALTWRHILNELGGIDLTPFKANSRPNTPPTSDASDPTNGTTNKATASTTAEFSLQGWLISLTAAHINQAVMPDVESIHYSLTDAPPPLWCYTERALENLQPQHRLIILMAQTFAWSDTRIAAYLQAEGEQISPSAVRSELSRAYQALESAIPDDIRAIYLEQRTPLLAPAVNQLVDPAIASVRGHQGSSAMPGLMTIEFDEAP